MDLSISNVGTLFGLHEMIYLGLVLIPIEAAAEIRSTSPRTPHVRRCVSLPERRWEYWRSIEPPCSPRRLVERGRGIRGRLAPNSLTPYCCAMRKALGFAVTLCAVVFAACSSSRRAMLP